MQPSSIIVKLNFDAGRVTQYGRGWGFVIRDNIDEVVLVGDKQNEGSLVPEMGESKACLFTLKAAGAYGFERLAVDGDSMSLISKLKKGDKPNSLVSFFF